MSGLLGDFGGASRVLTRRPGYALAVIATLALGVGAVTAVYALLDQVLLRPLPFADADRLVLVRQRNAQADWNTSVADYQAIAAQTATFESVAAMRSQELIISGGERPEWVSARLVTAGFFDVMAVAPARGRAFQPGEDQPGAARTVVLGHAFAARRYGDRDPLGETLTLDGQPHTVVGVMPPGVERLAAMRADLWPVLQLAAPTRRGPFFLSTLGRLKPGATLEQAREDLDAISRRIFPLWANGFQDGGARLTPYGLKDRVVGGIGSFLWLAFGAVLAVLLIAVVNVANLALMRVTERAQDLAVRAALGASRGRLARLVIAESLFLAGLGGALGLGFAAVLIELYRALGPNLPRLAEVAVDWRVAGFAAAATLSSGALIGVLPLVFGRVGQSATAQRQTRSTGADTGQRVFRNGLVALEFALALPLLAAAGLLINSLIKLQAVDPGFVADRLLTARVRLLETKYPEGADRLRFWERGLVELQSLPGVSAAGLAGALPPSCGCYNNFDIVGRPAQGGEQPQSPWIAVTPGYFEVLGARLVDGRWFNAGDTPDTTPVLLVTETWARRHFPGESAVGKRVYEGGDTSREVEIVGVVSDAKFDDLRNAGEAVYAPMSQGWSNNPAYLYLRTGTDPLALAEPLRAALARLDADLAPHDVRPMNHLLEEATGDQRHWAAVIAGFALAAVLLSAVGVFGVLAYYVSRQYREIGIRLALGADARRVSRMVIGRGFLSALAGTGFGLGLAFALVRGLDALLFGVSGLDPLNLAAACVLLLAVAYAACWLPARRAARIDPMVALRHE